MLGTVEAPDGSQLTVADVPGLIEGASEGIGLGHDFLAHLERARLLVHVIDASEGDADERFATIDRELALYGAGLDERPQIVVLNKADLSPEPADVHGRGRADPDRPPRLVRHRRGHRRAEAGAVRALPDALRSPARARCRAARVPRLSAARRPHAGGSGSSAPTRGFRVVGDVPGRRRARGGPPVRRRPQGRAQVEIGDEELEWAP